MLATRMGAGTCEWAEAAAIACLKFYLLYRSTNPHSCLSLLLQAV
jgi:hypothetical protein